MMQLSMLICYSSLISVIVIRPLKGFQLDGRHPCVHHNYHHFFQKISGLPTSLKREPPRTAISPDGESSSSGIARVEIKLTVFECYSREQIIKFFANFGLWYISGSW